MPKINKPLVITHRGESHDAPENTLAAIDLAWERGADAVEIDVHLSKDNNVVVIHDFNTHWLGGVSKKVAAQTLSELKQLNVGSWKNERWWGEKISTLNEVMETVPPGNGWSLKYKAAERSCLFSRRIWRPQAWKRLRSSLSTTLSSQSFIIGLFTLSLYAQPSFPVL
jgi:glycerophosphoryl diester phosphodiesterase